MEINKYHNSKIYQITDIGYSKCYIGSTTEELSQRMARHRADYKRFLNGNKRHNVRAFDLFDEFGVENCKIELIEYYKCDTLAELRRKEGEHIKNTTECVNKNVAGRTQKEYKEQNRDKINEYKKEYREQNRDKINEYKKEYREQNKDKIKEYQQANKDKIKEYQQANKDRINELKKKYREANKDKVKEYERKYREQNKDKINELARVKYKLKHSALGIPRAEQNKM